MVETLLVHGTSSGYTKHGCRCDRCKDYNRERQLDWRRRQSEKRAVAAEVDDKVGTAWKTEAACKGHPTDWWFDSKSQSPEYKQAMRICAACPVRTQCLEWALQWPAHDMHGIWGGTSQRERVRITDQRKAPTCPEPLTLRTVGRLSGITYRKP